MGAVHAASVCRYRRLVNESTSDYPKGPLVNLVRQSGEGRRLHSRYLHLRHSAGEVTETIARIRLQAFNNRVAGDNTAGITPLL